MNKKIIKQIVLLVACALFSLAAYAVNINKASAEQIAEALKGVGAIKAEAIVAYRKKNGPFKTMKGLINVKGIGVATVDKNQKNIQLQ
jgi:competence protein ComEA